MRWLVTSREPLHVAEEQVYRLEPLRVPDDDNDFDAAMACGSVQLLAQRAAAADPGFVLHRGNLATAIDLCRQLDGLPLAIEMAASRISVLSLEGVHEQLGQRLRLLSGGRGAHPRHLTLRSTFDWSYGLLSSQEQQVFRRLQPFVGGFRTEMAQRLVCMGADTGSSAELDTWQTLEALSALIEKSLVQRGQGPAHRNRLLESARDYAAERLGETGEAKTLRRRHAEVIANWFGTAQADLMQLRDNQWTARYLPERANLLHALHWACRHGEPDLLARLVAALAQLDSFIQMPAEILHLAVPMPALEAAQPALRAAAHLEFSWAHYGEGSREMGTTLALRALEDFRAIGDRAGEHRALAQLVRLYESREDLLDEAREVWKVLQRIDPGQVPLRQQLWAAMAISDVLAIAMPA